MYFLNCLSIPRCTYHTFHISDQQGAPFHLALSSFAQFFSASSESSIFSSIIKYPEANPMSFHLSTGTKLAPNVGPQHCFLIQSAEHCWGVHILHCILHISFKSSFTSLEVATVGSLLGTCWLATRP